MNDKQAKSVRKYLKTLIPEANMRDRSYLKHNRTGVIINHPDSARGIYLSLKKVWKGRQHGPAIGGD